MTNSFDRKIKKSSDNRSSIWYNLSRCLIGGISLVKRCFKTFKKRYFYIFNIPINIKSDNTYFSTIIAKDFLNNYDNYTIEENINILKGKYNDINDLINN